MERLKKGFFYENKYNYYQHWNVDGLPAAYAGSQTKNLTT